MTWIVVRAMIIVSAAQGRRKRQPTAGERLTSRIELSLAFKHYWSQPTRSCHLWRFARPTSCTVASMVARS